MAKTRQFRAFGRDIIIGKRLFGFGKEEESFGIVSNIGVDSRSLKKLDAYKGIVQACVSLIGEAAGGMYDPIAYRKKGDQLEATEHEFIQLLRRPSGNDVKSSSFSSYDLWEATASFLKLQGECYWYMALGQTSGRPREIVILRPDRVGIDLDDNGDINGYFIRRSQGKPIPLEVNEILHFKQFNPKDPYHGKSTVEAGDDYIATDELTSRFTRNFFDNNAGLSGILEIKGEVTKNAFKKFVRAWRSKYEGIDSAGKVAIIRASEAAFTKVGLGLDEIDMGALRKMSQEDVAMMFRVPLALLGKLSEGTGLGRANIETLEYIFLKWNINNMFKKFDAIVDFAIERYYPQDKDLTIGHRNIIPADKEYELNKRDKGVDRWISRNEIRNEDGLDEVEGGNDLRAPLSSFPISESISGGSGSSTESKGIVLKIRRKAAPASTVEPKKKDESSSESETNTTTINAENKENFRLALMRNQSAYERSYKKKMKPILQEQHEEALVNLEALAGKGLTKEAQQKLFDDAAYDKKLLDSLVPVMTDLGKEQGALAMIFAGDEEGEFILNARYEKYVKARTQKMAQNFNDQTLEKLNKSLAEGIQEGESLSKLRKRVDVIYGDAEKYRTLRVARTETLNASNEATNEAYRQTGYVKGKEWYVNPDACELCTPFEGKTIGLDDTFVKEGESYEDSNGEAHENSYDDIDSPPLHPNCRCTILPVR